ncbi:MAG: hypothetical protein GXP55_01805 [Deltaproteobacteria bacterium]|nr:hypothetical protein [Deltaproteobacteria bacterium]
MARAKSKATPATQAPTKKHAKSKPPAGKKRFDGRKLMELAVQVMTDSLSEQRNDGKISPRVGAVLWKADGSLDTAYRGELRDGDHAEFTLLERKNRGERLDGAVLFSTLEPCAPGARREPKLGCAERIVLARIKEVWVGVADPDPTVDRKGIKYLSRPIRTRRPTSASRCTVTQERRRRTWATTCSAR